MFETVVHELALSSLSPPPPPPPPRFSWEKLLGLVFNGLTAIATVVGIFAKDVLGVDQYAKWFPVLLLALFLLSSAPLVLHVIRYFRKRSASVRAERARKDAERRELEGTAEVLNAVLKIVHDQLADDHYGSNSVNGAVSGLAGDLSSERAHAEREVFSELAKTIRVLPNKVELKNVELVGRLVNQLVHRYVELLPAHVERCEKIAHSMQGYERNRKLKDAQLLRAHVNAFVQDYNEHAKRAAVVRPENPILKKFSPSALLREPLPQIAAS